MPCKSCRPMHIAYAKMLLTVMHERGRIWIGPKQAGACLCSNTAQAFQQVGQIAMLQQILQPSVDHLLLQLCQTCARVLL